MSDINITNPCTFPLDKLECGFDRGNATLWINGKAFKFTIGQDIGFEVIGTDLQVGDATWNNRPSSLFGIKLNYATSQIWINREGGGIGISDIRPGASIQSFNLKNKPAMITRTSSGSLKVETIHDTYQIQ